MTTYAYEFEFYHSHFVVVNSPIYIIAHDVNHALELVKEYFPAFTVSGYRKLSNEPIKAGQLRELLKAWKLDNKQEDFEIK